MSNIHLEILDPERLEVFNLLSSLKSVIAETEKRFGGEFNKRLFLEQLLYTKDITDFGIDYINKKYSFEEISNFFENQVKNYTFLEQTISTGSLGSLP